MTGSAKQSRIPPLRKSGLLPPSLAELRRTRRRFAPRNDEVWRTAIRISRGTKCPSDASTSALERGGRRECRVLGTPAASCAKVESTRVVTTGTPKQSGIPRAMVLRFIPRSPRCTGLCSHHRAPIIIGALDSSVGESGPHGFAVRISRARQALPLRPSHPCPRFLTIAKRPSCGRDARRGATDLPDGTSGIFFAKGLDRISDNRHVGQISWASAEEIRETAFAKRMQNSQRAMKLWERGAPCAVRHNGLWRHLVLVR